MAERWETTVSRCQKSFKAALTTHSLTVATRTSYPGNSAHRAVVRAGPPTPSRHLSRTSENSRDIPVTGYWALKMASLAVNEMRTPRAGSLPGGNPSGAIERSRRSRLARPKRSRSMPNASTRVSAAIEPNTTVPLWVRLPTKPVGHSRFPPGPLLSGTSSWSPAPTNSSRTQSWTASLWASNKTDLRDDRGTVFGCGSDEAKHPPTQIASGNKRPNVATVGCLASS